MKYQAILFDMDGTLLDTLTDMQAAVNYILEKYGSLRRAGRSLRTRRPATRTCSAVFAPYEFA